MGSVVSRGVAVIASLLGSIGVLIAAAAAVLSVLYVAGATSTVDNALARVTDPVERASERIDAVEAASQSGRSALQSQIDELQSNATEATAGIATLSGHPLYSAVPVDLTDAEARLAEFEDRVAGLEASDESEVTERSELPTELASAGDVLDGIEETVDDLGDGLRFWIRVSGIVFLVLALWALWGQILLARYGFRSLRSRPNNATPTSSK